MQQNSRSSAAAIAASPDIDPDAHRLLIYGLVKRPLLFALEALARFPMDSRITFIECGVHKLHGLGFLPWTSA
jgi:sulfane dehydrogenase subunit SoxC